MHFSIFTCIIIELKIAVKTSMHMKKLQKQKSRNFQTTSCMTAQLGCFPPRPHNAEQERYKSINTVSRQQQVILTNPDVYIAYFHSSKCKQEMMIEKNSSAYLMEALYISNCELQSISIMVTCYTCNFNQVSKTAKTCFVQWKHEGLQHDNNFQTYN